LRRRGIEQSRPSVGLALGAGGGHGPYQGKSLNDRLAHWISQRNHQMPICCRSADTTQIDRFARLPANAACYHLASPLDTGQK
jgi:hypothetical protein